MKLENAHAVQMRNCHVFMMPLVSLAADFPEREQSMPTMLRLRRFSLAAV